MKTIKNRILKTSTLVLAIATTFLSCERELSDDIIAATFPSTAEIFTDAPIGLTDQFFRSFDPATGANTEGFGVDNNVAHTGNSSIRIDVPSDTDPLGTYIGGIFEDRGEGRNLTGYDALTFWAKGSTTATIGEVGFGTDFVANQYVTTVKNVELSTKWRKYIIPIPDPSKLTQEKGMFIFSAGSQSTGGNGYTFWIDELRFEKLGNIGQHRPQILGGITADFISIPGQTLSITGFTNIFNLSNGQDVSVSATSAYYSFSSSDPSVASVTDEGFVTVNSTGTAEITAVVNGVDVIGSVNVQSFSDQRIISVFSDFYANVPVDNYNGFYEPFQTTLGGLENEDGNNIINYTELNFVATEFYGRSNPNAVPINATEMTNLNIDLRVNETVSASDFVRLELINNFGAGQTSGSFTISGNDLVAGQFVSFSIPLGNFTGGLANRDALGALLFVTDGTIRNLSIDNIFFSKEVIEPLPNVDDSAATEFVVPVGFESSTLAYSFFGFGGAEASAIAANPSATGINPTANVMTVTKANGGQVFAGTALDFDQSIDFSTSQKVRIKVYSPKAGITIRMALELNGGGSQVVLDNNLSTANEWVELEFDFASVYNPAVNYGRIVVFFDFGVTGDGTTYHFDDIQIAN